jgi:hypothetical protein
MVETAFRGANYQAIVRPAQSRWITEIRRQGFPGNLATLTNGTRCIVDCQGSAWSPCLRSDESAFTIGMAQVIYVLFKLRKLNHETA